MKKQILALIACLMLVMSTTAQAVTLRVPVASPSLSFSGTTARGSAICQADGNTDRINAKLTLYEGNIYLDSWSASGNGTVPISGECLVKKGKSYRLVLTWSINGVAQANQSVTKTCP